MLEDVEIKAARGGVSISSKHSPVKDDYVAYGRILLEKQIVGDWRNQAGAIVLIVIGVVWLLGAAPNPRSPTQLSMM